MIRRRYQCPIRYSPLGSRAIGSAGLCSYGPGGPGRSDLGTRTSALKGANGYAPAGDWKGFLVDGRTRGEGM